MASKHELIKWAVIKEWTETGRGRLYCMNQGLATPFNGTSPIWFGPLKRKFKGFPDTFGFDRENNFEVPVYCVLEVKTIGHPKLSKEQKMYLNYVISIGGRAYVAMEDRSEKGYFIKEWEG